MEYQFRRVYVFPVSEARTDLFGLTAPFWKLISTMKS